MNLQEKIDSQESKDFKEFKKLLADIGKDTSGWVDMPRFSHYDCKKDGTAVELKHYGRNWRPSDIVKEWKLKMMAKAFKEDKMKEIFFVTFFLQGEGKMSEYKPVAYIWNLSWLSWSGNGKNFKAFYDGKEIEGRWDLYEKVHFDHNSELVWENWINLPRECAMKLEKVDDKWKIVSSSEYIKTKGGK